MTALIMLACLPVLMWVVQSVALWCNGMPIGIRLDAGVAPRNVRNICRATTPLLLGLVIIGYPLIATDLPIMKYYAGMLPVWRPMSHFAAGAAASVLILCILYLIWIIADRVIVEVHQERRRWVRRLLLLMPTALAGATIEELLFRGVLTADLLRNQWPRPAVLSVSAVIFALAHYVRSTKRKWTIGGHLALGLLLSLAFLRTETLWLAMGLHAGGILVIMGLRPFVRYRGPAWLTGASVYPYAGIVGVAGLGVLCIYVQAHFG